MTMRFPGQRRPPGQPALRSAATQPDLAVVPALTLVGGGGRRAVRVLDGCAPFGAGCDELVALLSDACSPADPLELRGEAEALAAFRAVHHRFRNRLPVAGAPRRAAARRAARRAQRPASSAAAPMVGSLLAVAASAALLLVGYSGSLGMPSPLHSSKPPSMGVATGTAQPRGAATGGGAVASRPPSRATGTLTDPGPGATGPGGQSSIADTASPPPPPGQFVAGESVRTTGAPPTPSSSGPPSASASKDEESSTPADRGRTTPTGEADRRERLSGRGHREGRSDRDGTPVTDATGTDSQTPPGRRDKAAEPPVEEAPSADSDTTSTAPQSTDVPNDAPSVDTVPPPAGPSPPAGTVTVVGRVMAFGEVVPPDVRAWCVAWRSGSARPQREAELLDLAGTETIGVYCYDVVIRTR